MLPLEEPSMRRPYASMLFAAAVIAALSAIAPSLGSGQTAQTASAIHVFAPLLDGVSLAGGKGLVAAPPARARMKPWELADAQKIADRRMREHWKVDHGILCFDGQGDNLCTIEDFIDVELLVDWKIPPGGDSGVYLRGTPQVQIWDARTNPEGSGGLFNNKGHPSHPLVVADKPPGEWNTFRIILRGDIVTVWLNGQLVVDHVPMENYWDPTRPLYRQGSIELQSHGGPLWFRNIFVKRLR